MNVVITSEIVQAYSVCPSKAYLLMYEKEEGALHEYEKILIRNQLVNQTRNLELLKQKNIDVYPYNIPNLKKGYKFLIDANLTYDNFQAYCPILTRFNKLSYNPTIFIGTHTVNKTDKLQLMFINYVLTEIQGKSSDKGYIINITGKSRRLKLLEYYLSLKYPISIYPEDEGYTVLIPDLTGCITQGETLEEVIENINEAGELWIERVYTSAKKEIPLPSKRI